MDAAHDHTSAHRRQAREAPCNAACEGVDLASIINSAMDVIVTVDASQRVVMFNRAAEKAFGVGSAEALGSPLDRFIPQRFRRAHGEHVESFGRTGTTTRAMGRLHTLWALRADGSEFPIEASISQAESGGEKYFTVILRDVSERLQLEGQLLQAQKMEGLGRLAGGVAHDFNTLLMAIFNDLTLAARKVGPDHPAQTSLARAQEAAQRAATLTRQLLAFSRKQSVARRTVALREVVSGFVPMLRRVLGRGVSLHVQLAEDTGNVVADPTQLEQVLMNLAVNARDAMPAGGSLTIETANVRLPAGGDAHTTEHVMIAVADTGAGMTEQVRTRAVEAFFTTKPAGHGTGLGLTTTHGIVQQSGGQLAIESEPGRGTTVRVYLPLVHERAERAREPEPRALDGSETILLVEDSAVVRELTAEALRDAGYTVLAAADAHQARLAASGHRGPIHLLVTGVAVRDAGGPQLVDALRSAHPGIGVVYVSGGGEPEIDAGADAERVAFLARPFMTDALLRAVRSVLDNGRT